MEELSEREIKIALEAQRVMERIITGDYGNTITAPVGMELYLWGFRKKERRGRHYRWIRREVENERKKKLYHKKKQSHNHSTY